MNYSKELTTLEQKQYALNILKIIADFCEENKINYILSDGTLIGAVRHNGFIPWDDDIDISMLRSDYNKFIELWNKQENGRYSLYCWENGNFQMAFAKVCDNNTICFEGNMKKATSGIWVDIFPLDFVPKEEKDIHSHFVNMKKYTDFLGINNIINHSNWINRIIQRIMNIPRCIKKSTLVYFSSAKSVYKKLQDELAKYGSSEMISNYIVIQRVTKKRMYGFPVTCCTDFIYHTFEGYDFRIPKDYDSLLRSFYGDYMKLPPENEQVNDHKVRAFII